MRPATWRRAQSNDKGDPEPRFRRAQTRAVQLAVLISLKEIRLPHVFWRRWFGGLARLLFPTAGSGDLGRVLQLAF